MRAHAIHLISIAFSSVSTRKSSCSKNTCRYTLCKYACTRCASVRVHKWVLEKNAAQADLYAWIVLVDYVTNSPPGTTNQMYPYTLPQLNNWALFYARQSITKLFFNHSLIKNNDAHAYIQVLSASRWLINSLTTVQYFGIASLTKHLYSTK